MSYPELDNLAHIGQLKREPPSARELSGLLASGERRLADARRGELASISGKPRLGISVWCRWNKILPSPLGATIFLRAIKYMVNC